MMIQGNYPQRFFDHNLPLSLPTPTASLAADTQHEPLTNIENGQPLNRPRRASAPLRTPGTSTPTPATDNSPPLTATAVAHQFDTRPTLRSVVSGMLEEAIKSVIRKKLGEENENAPLMDPLGEDYCKT